MRNFIEGFFEELSKKGRGESYVPTGRTIDGVEIPVEYINPLIRARSTLKQPEFEKYCLNILNKIEADSANAEAGVSKALEDEVENRINIHLEQKCKCDKSKELPKYQRRVDPKRLRTRY